MLRRFRDFTWRLVRRPRIAFRPDDCFLVSWPRSGNTWMTHMLIDVMDTEGAYAGRAKWLVGLGPAFHPRTLREAPELSPRIFKSHDRFAPCYLRGRVAYLARNGLDATVSYFHYRTHMAAAAADWDAFLDRCLADRVRLGGWHRHVEGWLAHRDHPAIMVVRYEDLLANTAHELGRVLDHFGVKASAKRIAQAVERSSIDVVHASFRQQARARGKVFSGGVGGGHGGWKTRFTEAQRGRFMKTSADAMRLLGYSADPSGCAAAVLRAS